MSLPFLASCAPTVYLIRHGEKPVEGDGLSAQGVQRAQCLRNVFGKTSKYNIGHIMAQTPKQPSKAGDVSIKRQRPLETVKPLANDLNLAVDTSCDRDDAECVKSVITSYTGTGNILICWEHKKLTDLVKALGDESAPEYSHDAYNLIWTDTPPYNRIDDITSESCPGLDSS